mgnify:CR=1 FL=1
MGHQWAFSVQLIFLICVLVANDESNEALGTSKKISEMTMVEFRI